MFVWNDCIKKSDFYTEFREKMQFSVQNPNFHSFRSQILMIQSRQSCWNWLKNRRKNSRIKQNIMLSEQKAFYFVRVTSISTLEKDVNYQVLQFLPRASIWTNFSNFSGVGGSLPPQSTSLSLAWEIAYVYLLPPTPEKFQKFVHIEALGKNCISAPDSVFFAIVDC